jgi:hypothetical protein
MDEDEEDGVEMVEELNLDQALEVSGGQGVACSSS